MGNCAGTIGITLVALVAGIFGWSRLTRCPAVDGSHRCALDAGHSHATPHRFRDHSWWTL